jgi:hypothetical protein|tara:strand:+ start:4179 stop:4628 length:450 start_codon:yes stop_codon:yes gene_type:complete
MIVINTGAGQSFKVIPREYLTAFQTEIRDNLLNKKFTYFISDPTRVGDFLTFDGTFVNNASELASIFKEARYYDFDLFADFNFWNMNLSLWQMYDEIWQTDSNQKERIYKDRLFVTDQDIDQLNDNDHYNINKDVYITNDSYNNEYIVI